MAAPSLTYTLTNGATADASQVMQNYNDLLNGITDGTKDLTYNALTLNGLATLNGSVTLGNSSSKDLTINASLASSIAIKTTNSYDIGSSALALRSVYLASSDSAARATRVIGATVASNWTLTLPTGAGTNRFVLKTDGAGVSSWTPLIDPGLRMNYSIAVSVAGNAMTVALKGLDGNDPSSTNPVEIVFRNTTVTAGTPVVRQATAATSVVVSSGSTLGFTSATTQYSYIYALDNAGTIELAIIGGGNTIDQETVTTSTAEGGAGGADTRYTLYSTSARSNVPCRLLARLKHSLTTAGTWDEVPDEISLVVTEPQAVRSEVLADTANGLGAVSTRIRRFTNNSTIGTAITVADSANPGTTFTINEEGLYSCTYSDTFSTAARSFGISLNSSQLTTNIESITLADRLISTNAPDSNVGICSVCSCVVRLKPGDIIRAHTDGQTDGATLTLTRFRIIKIGI